MARKQETTVQYMNGSETIVKTNYHHGMHINHSMQVILIYIMHLPVIPTCLPLTHSIPKLFLALLSLCTGCPSIQYFVMAITCHCALQGCGHLILALKNHIPIQQQQVLLLNYTEIPGAT